MKIHSQNIGALGEDIACKYLQKKGYVIIERNFQNTRGYKYGEIDIIAQHNNILVFMEVKTRLIKKDEILIPEENISPTKLRHLETIASTYLGLHKLWGKEHRFDALSILLDLSIKNAKVRHLENIFF